VAGAIVTDVGLLEKVANAYFGEKATANPVKWVHEKGVFPWSKQEEILNSVRDHRYTAVPSCHNGGKSFIAAIATLWWLSTYPVGEAFVVSTAPSAPQVSAILWREIERLHRRWELDGTVSMGGQPEWKIGKELIAYGRKPADYDQTGFQGVHALYPLIIVDEAAGIPKLLWDAVDSLATNDNARVLAIGNPDDSASQFKINCLPHSGWSVIHIDGLYTPNMTEEAVREVSKQPDCGNLYEYMVENDIPFATEEIPDDLRPRLLGVRWVAERMKRWGIRRISREEAEEEADVGKWRTHPLWEAKVRGRFPVDSTEGTIPLGWVEQAIARWRNFTGSVDEIPGTRVFGCDPARFGDDETAISEKQGQYVIKVETVGGQDTMTTAKRLEAKMDQFVLAKAVVDVIGLGAGVVDRLREDGYSVYPFSASAATDARDRTGEFKFPNVRSAAWWKMREMLDPSHPGTNVMLPPDDDLSADLTAPRHEYRSGAKIYIEPKETTIKRLGRSPDKADAVIMSFWSDYGGGAGEPTVLEYGGESDYAMAWAGPDDYLEGVRPR
jgi:hypothetical protein